MARTNKPAGERVVAFFFFIVFSFLSFLNPSAAREILVDRMQV